MAAAEDVFEKAEEKLKLFSLIDSSNELVEAYSHGMKQRLIMAAALLHDPEIVIVDEPLVGLDPRGIKMVKELFRKLAEAGVSVFMSTHTLAIAEEIADRIGVIHQGKLLFLGTVAQLEERLSLDGSPLEELYLALTETPFELPLSVSGRPGNRPDAMSTESPSAPGKDEA